MTHLVSSIVIGLLVVYAGLLLMLWRFQDRILFQPPVGVASSPVEARRISYRAADGVELFAYLVGDCKQDSTLVIAFHGNAEIARWSVPWAATLVRQSSVCVLLPEYRGYDGLSGVPTYQTSAHDARAALRYVHDSLGVSSDNVVLFGHSLGSAIAAELAAAEQPRALVLQAPFSSARAMARRMAIPGLSAFFGVISRIHFDTIERVRALELPVWVAHGDRDMVVPVRMGREVFESAAQRGELLIIPGAGHNNVAEIGGRAYWDWFARALRAPKTTSASRDEGARIRSAL